MLVGGIVPRQVEQRTVALVLGTGQLRPDPLAQFEEELQFALALPGRCHRLVPPLQQTLGLRERAGFLHVGGCGQEEDFGLDVLGAQFAGFDLRAVLPPGGRLDHVQVTHHQPLQMGHAKPLQPAVGRAHCGVLPKDEVALHLVLEHAHSGLIGAVRPRQPRKVIIGPVVVRGRGFTPPGLQQADGVGVGVGPKALLLF